MSRSETTVETGPDQFEYRGLMAHAWDLLRGDTSRWPDGPFWRAIIEARGGPALDVGCGTGRLLLPFLAAGLDVDGVDNSPEMLALCRAKAAEAGVDVAGRLFEGAMETLRLSRRYAVILVPSLSFQLLTDPARAARAMSLMHDHLAPGGLLVVSFQSKLWPGRRTPEQLEWSDWFRLAEAVRPEDGQMIRRWIRARFDHVAQLQYEENRYELLRGDTVVASELHRRFPAVRWYSQAQAAGLFAPADFEDIRITAGDTLDAAQAEHTQFKVWGARSRQPLPSQRQAV